MISDSAVMNSQQTSSAVSPSEGHNPPRLSEGSAGVSSRVLRGSAGLRGIFRGFLGVVTVCLWPSGTVGLPADNSLRFVNIVVQIAVRLFKVKSLPDTCNGVLASFPPCKALACDSLSRARKIQKQFM